MRTPLSPTYALAQTFPISRRLRLLEAVVPQGGTRTCRASPQVFATVLDHLRSGGIYYARQTGPPFKGQSLYHPFRSARHARNTEWLTEVRTKRGLLPAWKPCQSGNPSGRPRTKPISDERQSSRLNLSEKELQKVRQETTRVKAASD